MKTDRKSLLDVQGLHRSEIFGSPTPPARVGAMRHLMNSIECLQAENERLRELAFPTAPEVNVAPTILEFAIAGGGDGLGRQSCAFLYLALQGHPIDLRNTVAELDLTRRQWWGRAMFEFSTGQWRGSREGEAAILAVHPELSNLL